MHGLWRAIALALVVAVTGCSFLMADKRLKTAPEAGDSPICDTNAVIPTVDLIVGISAAAIGVGAVLGDTSGSQRAMMAVVGGLGAAFIAGWWYGRKWHRECEAAKRAAGE